MVTDPRWKQLEGGSMVRGPRAEVVRSEVLKVRNQVPSVVFVDPPQHVRGGLQRTFRKEGLDFTRVHVHRSSEQRVLVEALPAGPTPGVRRPEARTDHVPKTGPLNDARGAGLADATNGEDDVQADAGHQRRPAAPPAACGKVSPSVPVPEVGVVQGHPHRDAAEVEVIGHEDEVHGAGHVRRESWTQPPMLADAFMVGRDAEDFPAPMPPQVFE